MVRCPPGDWLVIDSLRRSLDRAEEIPAVRLLDLRAEEAAAVALTHPHLDHADGLPAVLDRRRPGSPVGCLKAHFDPPDRWRGSHDSEEERKQAATEAALQRIFDIWEEEPEAEWDLLSQEKRAVGDAVATVAHPPADRAAKLAKRKYANRASSPFLVEWEEASVLLGADLPSREWRRLPSHFSASAGLSATGVLKASHHGSGDAQHVVAIGTPPRRARPCLITPWSRAERGRRLPRFEDEQGLDMLLETVEEVRLTAMPVPHDAIATPLFRRRDGLKSHKRERVGDLVLDFEPEQPRVDEAWIHVAIRGDGSVDKIQQGPAAVTVKP